MVGQILQMQEFKRDWLCVSIVRLIWLCPSVSMMVRGPTPWASNSVAAVCRRSWNRIGGSFAAVSSALSSWLTVRASAGVPRRLVNT